MDVKVFWEMAIDGRLTKMAEENPLEFEILCEEIVTQTIESSGGRSSLLQQCSDEITIKLLNKILPFDETSFFISAPPAVYERKRRRFIEACIRLLGDDRKIARANQLQWIIDCERNKHSTVFGKCVALTRMMNESFWGKNGLRDAVMEFVEVRKESRKEVCIESTCVVLSFKPVK